MALFAEGQGFEPWRSVTTPSGFQDRDLRRSELDGWLVDPVRCRVFAVATYGPRGQAACPAWAAWAMARRRAESGIVVSSSVSASPSSIHSRIIAENDRPALAAAARTCWSRLTGRRTPRMTIGSDSGGAASSASSSRYSTCPAANARKEAEQAALAVDVNS